MWRTEPWLRAEVPGTRKAKVLETPELTASILKRGRRVLMIVGAEVSENVSGEPTAQLIADIAETLEAHIATSSTVYRIFKDRGLTVAMLSPVEAAHRVTDSRWSGLDGGGSYKTVVIVGLPYYVAWLILSGLKNFASKVRTVSLERFYQPQASWSLKNLSVAEWESFLEELLKRLKS